MNWSNVGKAIKTKSKDTFKKGATKVGSTSKLLLKKSASHIGKKLMGQKDQTEQLECLKSCLECLTDKESQLTHKNGHKCPNCNFRVKSRNDWAQDEDSIENLLKKVKSSDILCYTDGKNSLIYCPSDRDLGRTSKLRKANPSSRDDETRENETSRWSQKDDQRYSQDRQRHSRSRHSPENSPRNSPEKEVERLGDTRLHSRQIGVQKSPKNSERQGHGRSQYSPEHSPRNSPAKEEEILEESGRHSRRNGVQKPPKNSDRQGHGRSQYSPDHSPRNSPAKEEEILEESGRHSRRNGVNESPENSNRQTHSRSRYSPENSLPAPEPLENSDRQRHSRDRYSFEHSPRNSPTKEEKRLEETRRHNKRNGAQKPLENSPRASSEMNGRRFSEDRRSEKKSEIRNDPRDLRRSHMEASSRKYSEDQRRDKSSEEHHDPEDRQRSHLESGSDGVFREQRKRRQSEIGTQMKDFPSQERRERNSEARISFRETHSNYPEIEDQRVSTERRMSVRSGSRVIPDPHFEEAENREPYEDERNEPYLDPANSGRIPKKSSLKKYPEHLPTSNQQYDVHQSPEEFQGNALKEWNELSPQEPQKSQMYGPTIAPEPTIHPHPTGQFQEQRPSRISPVQNFSRNSLGGRGKRQSLEQQRGLQYETFIPEETVSDQPYGPHLPFGNFPANSITPQINGQNGHLAPSADYLVSSAEQGGTRRSSERHKSVQGLTVGLSGVAPRGYLETLPEHLVPSSHPQNMEVQRGSARRSSARLTMPAEPLAVRLSPAKSAVKPNGVLRTTKEAPILKRSLKESSVNNRRSMDPAGSQRPSPAGKQPLNKHHEHVHGANQSRGSLQKHGSSGNVCCANALACVCCAKNSIPGSLSTCCCRINAAHCGNNHAEGSSEPEDKENLSPVDSDHHHHHHHIVHHPSSTCVVCDDPDYFENVTHIHEVPSPMCNYHRFLCEQKKMSLADSSAHLHDDDVSPNAYKIREAISLPRFDLEKNKIINSSSDCDPKDLSVRTNHSYQGLNHSRFAMHPVDPHVLSLLYKNKQKYEDLGYTLPPFLPGQTADVVPGTSVSDNRNTLISAERAKEEIKSRSSKKGYTLDYSNQRTQAAKKGNTNPFSKSSIKSNDVARPNFVTYDPYETKNPQLFNVLRKSTGLTDANWFEKVAQKSPDLRPDHPSQNTSIAAPQLHQMQQSHGSERGSDISGYEMFLLANPELQPPSAYDLDAKKSVEERMAEARSSFYKYLSPKYSTSFKVRENGGRRYKMREERSKSRRNPCADQLIVCSCISTNADSVDSLETGSKLQRQVLHGPATNPSQECLNASVYHLSNHSDARMSSGASLPCDIQDEGRVFLSGPADGSNTNICHVGYTIMPVISSECLPLQHQSGVISDVTMASNYFGASERWARAKENWKE